MKEDLKYLLFILENIRRIGQDTSGGRAAFDASDTIQDAVLHNFQLLAETTKRLSVTHTLRWTGAESRVSAPSSFTTIGELTWKLCGRLLRRIYHG